MNQMVKRPNTCKHNFIGQNGQPELSSGDKLGVLSAEGRLRTKPLAVAVLQLLVHTHNDIAKNTLGIAFYATFFFYTESTLTILPSYVDLLTYLISAIIPLLLHCFKDCLIENLNKIVIRLKYGYMELLTATNISINGMSQK